MLMPYEAQVHYKNNKPLAAQQKTPWLNTKVAGSANKHAPDAGLHFYFTTTPMQGAAALKFGTFYFTYYVTFRGQKAITDVNLHPVDKVSQLQ